MLFWYVSLEVPVSAAQLPWVWTRYSHGYTKPGLGQSHTPIAAEKHLDKINDLKMEILETMIENENTKEEIRQWMVNHRAAVVIYDPPIEKIANRIVTLKREKWVDDVEQEERRIQRRLNEERRILEMEMETKKKDERETEEKKEDIC